MTTGYEDMQFLDRLRDIAIEHQIVSQAHAHNAAAIDEVVSFLSEHGFGDEASPGRVGRAAERLLNEGILVEKNGKYQIAEGRRDKVDVAMRLTENAFKTTWEDEESGTGP